MKELGVWEPLAVKQQTAKTAVEAATLLLRIDDIVSGISRKQAPGGLAALGSVSGGDVNMSYYVSKSNCVSGLGMHLA